MRHAHGTACLPRFVHTDKHRVSLVHITSDILFHTASFPFCAKPSHTVDFPSTAGNRGSVLIRSQPHEIYFEPYLHAFFAFLTLALLAFAFSHAMVKLRR